MEDVPAYQSPTVLHLLGADDLALEYRTLEARRNGIEPGDQPVGVSLQLIRMILVRPFLRHPLSEHRHRVDTFGRKGLVHHGGDRRVAERERGRLAEPGLLEGRLQVVDVVQHLDRPTVDLRVEPGIGREGRQLRERQVDLHGAASGLPAPDVGHEAVGQLALVDLLEERDLGVTRGNDDRRR